MPIHEQYLTYVLEQLRPIIPDTQAKKMFGGAGFYSQGIIFGLMDNDCIYLKVDEKTREDFIIAGQKPFDPYQDGKHLMQSYYSLPQDAIEDEKALSKWLKKALEAANRAAIAKKPKKKR